MRPHEGLFTGAVTVTDTNIVQAILALRIFLPRLSLSVSTRERSSLRDNLVPLGITRMSAGSMTCVGGHTAAGGAGAPQFEISDERSVADIMAMLKEKGYQPVLKDWMRI
jgi:2-iminoacetate synthase